MKIKKKEAGNGPKKNIALTKNNLAYLPLYGALEEEHGSLN